jgi:hypothetical protein
MTQYLKLMRELCPVNTVVENIVTNDELGWPSLVAQDTLATEIQNWCENFPPPPKYLKHLLKSLEKLISEREVESDSEESIYSDSFLEVFLQYSMKTRSQQMYSFILEEDEDIGYISYPLHSIGEAEVIHVPIYVKRSHNQVGTRVWSAGLFLAEYFQWMNASESSNSIWSNKCILELGAGVGITSLLLYHNLLMKSSEEMFSQLYITDYTESVLELIDHNIRITYDIAKTNYSSQVLQTMSLDWMNMTHENVITLAQCNCLFAADCTYSHDLNIALVELFKVYFHCHFQHHLQLDNSLISSINANNKNNNSNNNSFLPMELLKHHIPHVLIACTLRNEETYQTFLEALNNNADCFAYSDLTNNIHSSLDSFRLYYIPERSSVQVLCIYPSIVREMRSL